MRKVVIRGHEFEVSNNQEWFWTAVDKSSWEQDTFDVLDKYVTNGSVFVDVGAWNGIFSMYATKLGALNISFEPDKAIQTTLDYNLTKNHCANHHALAISNEECILRLGTQSHFGNSESSLLDRANTLNSIEVQSTTLSSFFDFDNANISLVKIDVEGAELLIFENIEGFVKKHKPKIYVSIHPAWFPNGDDDVKFLKDKFFKLFTVHRVIGKNTIDVLPKDFDMLVESGIHSFLLIAK